MFWQKNHCQWFFCDNFLIHAVISSRRCRNITGAPVVGDNLYGRDYELKALWERLEQGEHVLMLAPRRVGKTSLMLELRRQPRPNWHVIYVDVQGAQDAADLYADILAQLADHPKYRRGIESIPSWQAAKDILSAANFSAKTPVGDLRVEFASAMQADWHRRADQIRARLAATQPEGRLLIIIDELPFLVSRLVDNGAKRDAELLLSKLREWRQAPDLRGIVVTLAGGSIGLEGVVQRAGLSGTINDFVPFHLESWPRSTARQFLDEIGRSSGFPLGESTVEQVLDLLYDPVPYHLQLFFQVLRDECRDDPASLTAGLVKSCFEQQLAGASGTAHLDHYATRLEIALDERERAAALAILSRLSWLASPTEGVPVKELQQLAPRREDAFRYALRVLEADGYLHRDGDRVSFRSNLLRRWWRKHHAGDAP